MGERLAPWRRQVLEQQPQPWGSLSRSPCALSTHPGGLSTLKRPAPRLTVFGPVVETGTWGPQAQRGHG